VVVATLDAVGVALTLPSAAPADVGLGPGGETPGDAIRLNRSASK
jgi:hypothetical protein